MSSSSRRLAEAAVGAAPRRLAVPDPALDPFTAERVEAAAAEAYERGLAEGRRAAVEEARQAAAEASDRIGAAVAAAADEVLAALAEQRRAGALADVELARWMAELVLGREPHDGGAALLERCRQALERVDDRPVQVRCHPDDVDVLADGLVGRENDLEVVPDRGLAPGEAVLTGRWAHAELTRAVAWDLIEEAVGEAGAPLGEAHDG